MTMSKERAFIPATAIITYLRYLKLTEAEQTLALRIIRMIDLVETSQHNKRERAKS